MRRTKDARIAMDRLAEALGWTLRSTGGAWEITSPVCYQGLTYTAREALCVMTRFAMAPPRSGGMDWAPSYIRDRIRFQPAHIFHPKHGACLVLPARIGATEEATLYRAYFQPELVS